MFYSCFGQMKKILYDDLICNFIKLNSRAKSSSEFKYEMCVYVREKETFHFNSS
jgi:hypothetical protein